MLCCALELSGTLECLDDPSWCAGVSMLTELQEMVSPLLRFLRRLVQSQQLLTVHRLPDSLFSMLGLTEPLSVQQLMQRLIPGEEDHLPSLLLRPPLRRTTQPGAPEHGLVRKLLGQVSVKGEDLLLQMGTDIPARYHRLRASIPGKLWRWQEVAGWRWTGDVEHINVLELRAVKTSLAWRIRELKEERTRFLHLADSLVVLHALSRGRSSSRKLRRSLAKISAMLLASGLQGTWGYIDTHQNPADKPSRRPLHRKWVRRLPK